MLIYNNFIEKNMQLRDYMCVADWAFMLIYFIFINAC